MATTYEIRQNSQFNSTEVYFDGKPSAEVRTALKNLKFRWHSVKKCWYGYEMEETVAAAILNAEPVKDIENGSTVYGDGYMGGGSVYGAKSQKHLYGSELSKAIRQDIKAAGIKGVTVSCHTYSGGQNVTAKVKLTDDSFVDLDSFIAGYQISTSSGWLWDGEQDILAENYWYKFTAEEQQEARKKIAAAEYEKYTKHENNLNQFRLSDYPVFTSSTIAKIKKVQQIIENFRYDNSNSMVDYFDTNFYYDIRTVVA